MRGWGWVLDVDMRIWEMRRWGSGSGYRIRGSRLLGLDTGYEDMGFWGSVVGYRIQGDGGSGYGYRIRGYRR